MKNKIKMIIAVIGLIAIIPMIFGATTWGSSGNTQTQFNSGGAPECVGSGTMWRFPDGTSLLSQNNCSIGNYPTCCPQGYSCNATSSCVANTVQILSCGSYKTNATCTAFTPLDIEDNLYNIFLTNLGLDTDTELHFCSQDTDYEIYQYGTGDNCRAYWNCGCEWNSTDCLSVYYSNDCSTIIDPPINPPVEKCETSDPVTENLCGTEEDIYRVSWTGNFLINGASRGPTPECKNGNKDFPCPSRSEVPFFGFFNLIISCLLIAGIYFMYFGVRRK